MTCSNFINLQPNELISVNFKNTSCFHKFSLSLSIGMKFPSGKMIVELEVPSGFDDDFVMKELPSCIMVIIYLINLNISNAAYFFAECHSP